MGILKTFLRILRILKILRVLQTPIPVETAVTVSMRELLLAWGLLFLLSVLLLDLWQHMLRGNCNCQAKVPPTTMNGVSTTTKGHPGSVYKIRLRTVRVRCPRGKSKMESKIATCKYFEKR